MKALQEKFNKLNFLYELSKSAIISCFLKLIYVDKICKTCQLQKQTKNKFSQSTSISTSLLQLIHGNICKPFKHPIYNGVLYFIMFIDDHTRYT
uniref:Uncharacterized protein n=2 Tax=Physcomitrium patens TaxID=3218 RepID=A0A2K1KV23_PHYPA|nr:hypothetical protein PHYPA_004605 [Physcomitrium patens]